MPISGDLSEFPLPEVLLLIGNRTGRLTVREVRGCAPVGIDLSHGRALALHIDNTAITQPRQIVAELSFLIELGDGTFEFQAQPVKAVERDEPLAISHLVMSLVLHVDEKLARRQAVLAAETFYLLSTPLPDVTLDDAEDLFFQQSRQLLAGGVRAEDLAEYLGLPGDVTRRRLERLQHLAFVKVQETADVEALRASLTDEEISRKSGEFLFAAEAAEHIRRSGKLLQLPRTG